MLEATIDSYINGAGLCFFITLIYLLIGWGVQSMRNREFTELSYWKGSSIICGISLLVLLVFGDIAHPQDVKPKKQSAFQKIKTSIDTSSAMNKFADKFGEAIDKLDKATTPENMEKKTETIKKSIDDVSEHAQEKIAETTDEAIKQVRDKAVGVIARGGMIFGSIFVGLILCFIWGRKLLKNDKDRNGNISKHESKDDKKSGKK